MVGGLAFVPQVTNISFLPTTSIHHQEKRLGELMKWSPINCFDLWSHFLKLFLYGNVQRSVMRIFWTVSGLTEKIRSVSDIPFSKWLILQGLFDADTKEGGIDLEIIVTGSSSEGNAKVDGRGSEGVSLGESCGLSGSAVDDGSRGVRGLTSRLSGSSLAELAFGILERSIEWTRC